MAADVDISKFDFQEKDGRSQDSLDYLIVVAHRETGEFYRYDQKVEMNLLPATRQRLSTSWFPVPWRRRPRRSAGPGRRPRSRRSRSRA